MTTCNGHTTACTGGPLIPVRIRSDRRETMVCRGCLDVWLAMGADVVDLRPEWVKRGTAKDFSGAAR